MAKITPLKYMGYFLSFPEVASINDVGVLLILHFYVRIETRGVKGMHIFYGFSTICVVFLAPSASV